MSNSIGCSCGADNIPGSVHAPSCDEHDDVAAAVESRWGQPGVFVPPSIWREITALAASHPDGCVCVACRAAAGDGGAAATIIRKGLGL